MDKRIVSAKRLGRVLERIDSLPTISIVAHQVGELVNDPHADARSIGRVLKSDQSLSAKVLKLANSPYYCIPGGVSDVTRAISFLGFNTLYQLVLSVSVLSALSGDEKTDLSPRELWKHALGCAALAEIIARAINLPDPEVCFTAGLLHDIGKVALLQIAPYQFQEAVVTARNRGLSVHEATSLVGLPDHGKVGARLAERWRFPMPIRVAISHHRYAKEAQRFGLAQHLGNYLDVVVLANTLVRRFGFGDPGDDVLPALDADLFARLNLTAGKVQSFRDELMRAVERSKAFLDLVA